MITLWLKTLWENLFLRVFVVKKETRGETAALLSGSLSLTGIYLWIIVNCQLSIIHCQLKIHLQFPSFPNWFKKIHHSQNDQGIKRKDQLVKRNKQPRTNPSDTIEKR
jgi:hypothetical protein